MARTHLDPEGPKEVLAEVLAAPAKKKRQRTEHPGVLLLPPKGLNKNHRVRWKDPETGQVKVKNLTPGDAKNKDTRKAFAMRLFKQLRRRTEDITAGAVPHRAADKTLKDALDQYFQDRGHLKAEKTVFVYRGACSVLLEWAEKHDVYTVRQLDKAKLHAFAVSRTKAKKMQPIRGGKRGARQGSGKRSPHSINRELRAISTVLNYLRSADVVRLSSDDLADALQRIPASVERRPFLQPAQIQELIAACVKHDAKTFDLCRDGSKDTPRYTPVQEFVRFVLLTGMRPGEATAILGSDCNEQKIHVRAAVAKTRKPRTVDLSVTPSLITMELHRRRGPLFPFTTGELDAVRDRLMGEGAPKFDWPMLRRTCGTYLTCAPSIYGAASAFMSAKRLGHSVSIAEKHYVGEVTVSPEAKTLEQAMGLVPTTQAVDQ